MIVPATAKLDYTVNASGENGDEGDGGRDQEPFKARAGPEVGEGGIENRFLSRRADDEGETEDGKDRECKDLKDQTRKHDVVAHVEGLLVGG